ncbi:putative glutamate/gamma-aminobutyrate antiporter [Pediococcus damnosus]|uniref:amino acid permease n=1 Tax=Pediococcus damnosus TaxID=51663 RepID=UPI00078BE3A8|nr:amino acid permease [Pediococcus damnosus]AMV69946.1 putative glutamate/gamma-aminobutyrate antiporter [Pediococcus damnosus]
MTKKASKLNLFGFFTLTASMLMSADEYPAFAQSGLLAVCYLVLAGVFWFLPVALCSAEMATIDGNTQGGVFAWVKNSLGTRWGFLAVFFQWLQITVNFITMIYFIIGALSYVLNFPALNHNPLIKWAAFLVIYWVMTFIQLGGVAKTDKLVSISFMIGIILPSVILLIMGIMYVLKTGHVQFDVSLTDNVHTLATNFSIGTIVPYILAFTGIEASASYINDLDRPSRNYPLCMIILVGFAILVDSLGGLSVAAVIPANHLTLNQGVIQAVAQMMKVTFPAIQWGVHVIGILMALGMLGEISSWIIGPVKSLFVTAEDGILPHYFMHVNHDGVPVRLIMVQGIVVTLISGFLTVVLKGSNDAYQMAMALTVMLYIVTYILIFVAYIHQEKNAPQIKRGFQIPGGKVFRYVVASIGLVTSVVVLGSTFIPSTSIKTISPHLYTLLMVLFFVVVIGITELIYEVGIHRHKKPTYNFTIRHRRPEEVDKHVFLKGRYEHVLQHVEKDVSKKFDQEEKKFEKR